MTQNLLLQAIEQFSDGFLFERLCNDIMRLQYPGFKPGGGVHDLGVDGLFVIEKDEIRLYFKSLDSRQKISVFQYSLQSTWEEKIKTTLKKLDKNKIIYDNLVFVTNRIVNQAALIKLQRDTMKNYAKALEVHSQELLRIYLETPQNSYLIENYFASYLNQIKRLGMESSILTEISLNESRKRRAMLLLSVCVRSQEGEEVKEAAATEVVLGCVYKERSKSAISRQGIQLELEATFGDKNVLSDDLLDTILEKLVIDKRVRKIEESFILSETELARIDAKIELAYEDDRAFYNGLISEIKRYRDLTSAEEQEVKTTLTKGIGRFFERKGIEIARGFCNDCDASISCSEYPELNLIAQEVTSPLNAELRQKTIQVLRRLFISPTSIEAQYLYGIAESYLVYASFNLDSDARILDLENIRKNVLFVDTDILLQLQMGDERLQNLYYKMLKATQNLDITMYTLPQLVDEFVYKINKSHKEYIYMKRPRQLTIEVLDDLGDIFRTYFTRIEHTGQSWDQFIASMIGTSSNLNAQRQFVVSRLEMEYGIQTKSFLSSTHFDENKVSSFAMEIAQAHKELQVFKHDNLYKTDAFIAMLVEELQKDNNKNNNNKQFWLISSDTILPKVWQSCFLKGKRRARVLPPQNWFQYVAHNPASKSKAADFAVLMKSLSVSSARPKVRRNLLLTLIRFGVDISKYTTEALSELSNRLYEKWIWQKVVTRQEPQVDKNETAELSHALNSVLKEIEELIAPERIELREKSREDKLMIDLLAKKNRTLEDQLKYYKKKAIGKRRYDRQFERKTVKR